MNNKVSVPLIGQTLAVVEKFADDSSWLGVSVPETSGEPFVDNDEEVPGPNIQPERKQANRYNRRRRRRFEIKSNVRVLQWKQAYPQPDIASLVDANADGILFITDQDYPQGAELLVKFPYPGNGSPQQVGHVVRVKILSDGRRCVAVALK